MTARHLKLETDLEIIDNLLNKRYQNGQGLDSGTRDHLTRRRKRSNNSSKRSRPHD